MKKLILLLALTLFFGCTKDEIVVNDGQLVFEISLDGDSFDPYERYSVVTSYGGTQLGVDGKLKKIFILYLQIDDGEVRLDRQHFAMYLLDSDAVEIITPYGPYDPLLICLTAEGEFYNPYIQRTMTLSLRLQNFPIGQDISSTPYGYLLD